MYRVRLDTSDDFQSWRRAARQLVIAGVDENEVDWQTQDSGSDLFATDAIASLPDTKGELRVSRRFPELAQLVICHSDRSRFALLYRLLHRLQSEPKLLERVNDADVHQAEALAKAVRRDRHKMHAFVRFREIQDFDGPRFIAWYEPAHHVVRIGAPFFVERFASMRWSILTPELCAHWDLQALTFGPGAQKSDAPADDQIEEIWRTYYANIFNPARLKIGAMKREMPVRFWRNLPESSLIEPLIKSAHLRERGLIEQAPAPEAPHAPRILRRLEESRHRPAPSEGTLAALQQDVDGCQLCPLWETATQAVFGEGPAQARIMVVGEQPGDREDIEGKPFIGPAGQLLDRAIAAAGLDRSTIYVTNAVKHFKYEPRGKRRLHKSPNTMEIDTCRHWLRQEIALVRPELTIAMGASALRSLIGRPLPVQQVRGTVLHSPYAGDVLATVHPSYLLRLPDERTRELEYARFVADLTTAAKHLVTT